MLYVNASDENNVETVRTKIKSFASSVGFNPIKIIILDESDFLTPSAQAALRNMMETFSRTTRFILTCNYVERMIEPIVSRTQQFHITPPTKIDVAKHIAGLLKSEEITYVPTDVKLMVDAYYPDIRKIINECQLHTQDTTLVIDTSEVISNDVNLKIINLLAERGDTKRRFQEIRQLVADAGIRDFAQLFSLLYEKVDHYAQGNISQAILHIAEGHRWDSLVVSKEINFCATIVNLLSVVG